jgi:hypothetical protein
MVRLLEQVIREAHQLAAAHSGSFSPACSDSLRRSKMREQPKFRRIQAFGQSRAACFRCSRHRTGARGRRSPIGPLRGRTATSTHLLSALKWGGQVDKTRKRWYRFRIVISSMVRMEVLANFYRKPALDAGSRSRFDKVRPRSSRNS